MKRQEKYPNTRYFRFFNANPKNKITTDCVVRAISNVLQQPWEQTLRELTELGIKMGKVFDDKAVFGKYLCQKGCVFHSQPRFQDNKKLTGQDFCRHLQDHRIPDRIVAKIGGNHVVAIINGVIEDTWDSSNGCIGNYWTLYPYRES